MYRISPVVLFLAACRAPEVRPEPASVTPVTSTSAARPDPPASTSVGARPRAPVAAPSAASPEPPADVNPAAPVGSGAGDAGCQLKVTAVLKADVFRGAASTPSRQRAMERLSPRERDRWNGADHGIKHLSCQYAVTMNGKKFTYQHHGGMTPLFDHKLEPRECGSPELIGKVEADLVNTTHQCTDPHAGAFWGYDLVEVTP